MGFRRPTANTPLDSKREDPLERAKRLARRITPEEQIERGLGVLEDAGFDSDQIDYMAGLVGCKAEDLAISISTASPHIGANIGHGTEGHREGFGADERRLLTEIRSLLEPAAAESPPRCLTREEAANYLGIEPPQLDYLVRARKIRFVKLGDQRGRVFRLKDIDEFLEQNLQLTAEEMLKARRKPR
ncbi:MAG: helix-turn-helix domain-containing protein [Thermoguttaceae bacterium]